MVALERTDDAHGDRFAHAEGVAYGEHEIADVRFVGLGESDGGQCAGQVDFDDGEIGFRVGADYMGTGFAAIGQRHFNLVGGFDDMMIGQDVTVGADDHAGTQAGAGLRLVGLILEKELESGVVAEGAERRFDCGAGKNVDHSRHGFLGRAAEAGCGRLRFSRVGIALVQGDHAVARRIRQQLGFEGVDDEQ